jgi:glutathione S-transferase
VPVLKDGEKIIYDSKKILIYLARAYGLPHWYPHNTKEAASIDAWLTVAEQDVTHGPNALRFHHKFGRALNVEEATVITNKLLHHLDKHLTQHEWLATIQITIADIAMYPYLALANEGHVNVSLFPAVEKWLARIEALPGYISMPGIRVHV